MLLASNHMFPTGSIECVFERMAKAGAGGLDLFPPHVQFLNQPRFSEANLAVCRQAAEAVGLPVRSIIGSSLPGQPGFTAYQDEDAAAGRAGTVAFVKHNVEVAKILGATHISAAEGRCPDGADEQVMWERLVAALKESAPILEQAGVTLGLELHPGLLASTPEKAPKLVDAVGSKAVRICLDFCHANVITEGDPVGMIKALAGTMSSIHIADGVRVPGLHLPIGGGEIDVDACIQAVKDDGFDGAWVLCMYGCSFPELTLRTAVAFLEERHPDILAG